MLIAFERQSFVNHLAPQLIICCSAAVDGVCEVLNSWCPHCVFSSWQSWEQYSKGAETAATASLLYWYVS